jgi:hypothetical protein
VGRRSSPATSPRRLRCYDAAWPAPAGPQRRMSARPVPVVPAQLPLDVAGFTARTAELAWLDALASTVGQRSTAVVITAVCGMPGVGKTPLAVHWAHGASGRFPDGQLYVNLCGFASSGAALSPADAISGFLDALGMRRRLLRPAVWNMRGCTSDERNRRHVVAPYATFVIGVAGSNETVPQHRRHDSRGTISGRSCRSVIGTGWQYSAPVGPPPPERSPRWLRGLRPCRLFTGRVCTRNAVCPRG